MRKKGTEQRRSWMYYSGEVLESSNDCSWQLYQLYLIFESLFCCLYEYIKVFSYFQFKILEKKVIFF